MIASRRASAVVVWVVLLGIAAALVAPSLECLRCWSQHYDWRYFQAMEEVFRRSVVEYRQVPLWNPYACGGEVGVANPQSTALAPTFLLSILLGTPLGLKAALFVYLLAALHGAYALARATGASSAAALVGGVAYGGSGWFALHLSTGHINFAGAALYPYLLLSYAYAVDPERRRSWVFVVPGGALIAWMAALGGTYTVPMAVVLLCTLAATDAARQRSVRPLAVVVALGAVALALGAARFLPLLEFVRDHPRHVPEKDGNNALDVGRMFLAWRQKLAPVSGHVYWWHEYCCHLPYLALVLAAVAALHKTPLRRHPWRWLPAALFVTWTLFALVLPDADRGLGRRVIPYRDAYHLLGAASLVLLTWRTAAFRFVPVVVIGLGIVAGTAWPHGPWWLIRMLPLYRDLRVPARYLVMVALVASLWSARGLDVVVGWLFANRGAGVARAFEIAALVLVVGETLAFDLPAYRDARLADLGEPPSPPPPYNQIEGQWSEMLNGIIAGRGVLKCDEEAPLQRGELDAGDVEQVRLVDPAAGAVRLLRWTPNALTLECDLARPTDVLVNENWNEHWTIDGVGDSVGSGVGGGEVRNVAGRLAVRPASLGKSRMVLRYRPRSFVAGAWLSAISLPAALLAFAWGLARRRRAAAPLPQAHAGP